MLLEVQSGQGDFIHMVCSLVLVFGTLDLFFLFRVGDNRNTEHLKQCIKVAIKKSAVIYYSWLWLAYFVWAMPLINNYYRRHSQIQLVSHRISLRQT